MGKLDDDDTLKMLVKLTSESKLLYKDLESTPKMRRARRLLYLAQLGLMTEKTVAADRKLTGGSVLNQRRQLRQKCAAWSLRTFPR